MSDEQLAVQIPLDSVLDVLTERIATLEKELAISKITVKTLAERNAILEQNLISKSVEMIEKPASEKPN